MIISHVCLIMLATLPAVPSLQPPAGSTLRPWVPGLAQQAGAVQPQQHLGQPQGQAQSQAEAAWAPE